MKKYANKVFTPVITLVLIVFAGIIFLSFRKTAEAKSAAAMVAHSHEVLFQTARILSGITDHETGTRGYILTGLPVYLEPLEKSKANVYRLIDTLRQLTIDNPAQQIRIDSLLHYANQRFRYSDSTVNERDKRGLETAIQAIASGTGRKYMEHIRQLASDMQQEENNLLTQRKIDNEKANGLLNKITVSIIVIILFLIIVFLRKDYLATVRSRMAEETLKKNEAFLQLMTNSVKDYAIFMLDLDGRMITWNKGAFLVTGYERQEVTGISMEIFYTEQDKSTDEPRRHLSLAKKYGQFETEGQRKRKDGGIYWANVVITALTDGRGSVGYSVIVRDISENKKAQEQLEFLSLQINQANDAIYTIDKDRKIKSWNVGAENLYGYKTREVLERDPNEVLKTDISEAEIVKALESLKEKDYWTGELTRKVKNGKNIYVRASTTTIRDNKQNITGYVAVSFDITEQKKLLERVNHLASLVEQSTEAIISTGPDEQIISWNSGAEKLFGYSKDEVIGKKASLFGLTGLPDSGIINGVVRQANWKTEMSFRDKNGRSFFGSLNANVIRNEQGEINATGFIINDITLRQKLEEDLIRSNEDLEQRVKERTDEIVKNEQRFRALIENSAEGVSLLDENSNVIYRSPSARKIIGDNPTKNTISYAHPDDLNIFKDKFSKALENPHVPVPYNIRYYNPAGHYFWTEGTFTNLLDVEGVNAIVANYRDVTQRKEAEEKLIASEKQFRYTLDNMLEGVQIIGFDWRYIYVNDSMAKHGRYSKEELLGHTVMEKYPGIEQTGIFKIYQQCFDERRSIHLENEFVFPDGSVAWFELSFQPVPEGLFILSVDITDRKKAEGELIKSERLYRNLFENMLHGFCYCEAEFENDQLKDFIYLSVNREYEMLTGLTNITGKRMSDINPALLSAENEYISIITRVAQGGKPEKFETYVKALDMWFSISIYSPEKGYFVNLVDNITSSKQHQQNISKLNTELEERVVKRTEQLKKSNEELEAFSYSVSHDLRAPLRAIIGFTAILEDDYSSQLDDEARRITSIIKSNTLKMGSLIDDLLTFSRMGRQDMVKTAINTQDMVGEIINQHDIKQYNNNRPVEWKIHNLPDIAGDVNTIRQVWINLISNAVKYSGKAEMPVVEIGSFKQGEYNVFFVKDNGAGFDEKYKNKLFRVFQRLHSADEFEGTGIGLAIVEKIISKHDGKVWAESQPGKGASFYFSLPDSE